MGIEIDGNTMKISGELLRVVILDVSGVYIQIYDEIHCTKTRYQELLSEFGGSDRFRIFLI